eukprot:9892764-Ditylum_brightwellii.AAC.1
MPMGALNLAPTFVAMMMVMQDKWEKKREELGLTTCSSRVIKHCGSKVIVNDVLLHGREARELLRYFRIVLEVFQHHRATVKLQKCRWFQSQCKFVGIDVCAGGNKPAASKYEAFKQLQRPNRWADLWMLIGVFGFYSRHLPLYELDLGPWRAILARQSQPGEVAVDEEMEKMARLWTKECKQLLNCLKADILAGPMLSRPDSERRFYLKTDWSKEGMAAALLQAGYNFLCMDGVPALPIDSY